MNGDNEAPSKAVTPPINSVSDEEIARLVKKLRTKTERVHDLSGVGYNDDLDCHRAADLLEAFVACLTSPAAAPVEAVELMVTELLDTSKVADPQMRKRAAFMLMRLYTHPAPSASREVTDEMVERAAQELLAYGEFSSIPWRNHDNALKAARAALLAALPKREG